MSFLLKCFAKYIANGPELASNSRSIGFLLPILTTDYAGFVFAEVQHILNLHDLDLAPDLQLKEPLVEFTLVEAMHPMGSFCHSTGLLRTGSVTSRMHRCSHEENAKIRQMT